MSEKDGDDDGNGAGEGDDGLDSDEDSDEESDGDVGGMSLIGCCRVCFPRGALLMSALIYSTC